MNFNTIRSTETAIIENGIPESFYASIFEIDILKIIRVFVAYKFIIESKNKAL